jgi:prolipoprotein diacylglyceryltransferase
MLWNFGGAALIVWLGHRFRLRAPGVFCLYVMIYSLGRIFWEQLRVDPSKMFLGQRLNFYVALALFLGATVAFVWSVRRGPETADAPAAGVPRTPGGAKARPAGSPKRR